MLYLLYAGLKMFMSQFTTFQIKFLVKQEDQGLKPNSNYVHDIDLGLNVFVFADLISFTNLLCDVILYNFIIES